MQWITVNSEGTINGSSQPASTLAVTHPAVGTYCLTLPGTINASVSGNVQSHLHGFEDLTMIISSFVNTSACPGTMRIYTAKSGVLADYPFTLTYAMS